MLWLHAKNAMQNGPGVLEAATIRLGDARPDNKIRNGHAATKVLSNARLSS
jgi:hypothetical protein